MKKIYPFLGTLLLKAEEIKLPCEVFDQSGRSFDGQGWDEKVKPSCGGGGARA